MLLVSMLLKQESRQTARLLRESTLVALLVTPSPLTLPTTAIEHRNRYKYEESELDGHE
jgi:hypothetical protein